MKIFKKNNIFTIKNTFFVLHHHPFKFTNTQTTMYIAHRQIRLVVASLLSQWLLMFSLGTHMWHLYALPIYLQKFPLLQTFLLPVIICHVLYVEHRRDSLYIHTCYTTVFIFLSYINRFSKVINFSCPSSFQFSNNMTISSSFSCNVTLFTPFPFPPSTTPNPPQELS